MGFVLEEQGERERDDASEWSSDPMAEIAPFPLLMEALKPLLQVGTINTEGVFEAGLRYMVEGMRLTLEQRSSRAIRTGRRPERAARGAQVSRPRRR